MKMSPRDTRTFLFVLAIALVKQPPQSSADAHSCGETLSTRMNQDVFNKHRLRSRVIESISISRPLECYANCMKNCRCLSYHICNKGKLCELNSEAKENNISLFEQSDDCDYHRYKFSKQQASGDCTDPCCSSSQPCLNSGRCLPSCMENGRRFRCACHEGTNGDRCENLARSCAFYFKNSPRRNGLHLIYAPDNTTYRGYCHFSKTQAHTLVMSWSRDNHAVFKDKSLTDDYPVSQDSQNWKKYRLSFARMAGLRDQSVVWKILCSYDVQGMKSRDVLKVETVDQDPLSATDGVKCTKVKQVSIRGVACSNCVVPIIQGQNTWHMSYAFRACDGVEGYVNVVPSTMCSEDRPRYFGNYRNEKDCYDEQFSCTSSGEATTQVWFA